MSPALLNNLALLHPDQNQFTKAEQLTKRALGIQEKALGPDRPMLPAASITSPTSTTQKATTTSPRTPPSSVLWPFVKKHLAPFTPTSLRASITSPPFVTPRAFTSLRDNSSCAPFSILEKTLGPDHPKVAQCLNNLGLLYITQGQFRQAEPRFERSRSIQEAALGPNHPDLGVTLDHLALVYESNHRMREARELGTHR